MAEKSDPLKPDQERLIIALLSSKTKEQAAEAAEVSSSTMYRWLKEPAFKAAYKAALRETFSEATAMLSKGARIAVKALLDELDPATKTGEFAVILAASRILDKAFKAQTAVAVEEELEELRTVMNALKAGQPPAPPVIERPIEEIKMAANEQAEATRLRVAWMSEIGNSAEEIDDSLRYNRPTNAAEEKYLLELVRKMMATENGERIEP